MEKVTVSAAALRRVLNALNGPGYYIRELQVTRNPMISPDNPINALCDEYNAAVEAFNAGAVVASGTEYGWLVENGKQGDELRYRTWRDGLPEWTADHDEATRYCRRIDAERAHREDEDAWRIVQHAWHNLPPNVGVNRRA